METDEADSAHFTSSLHQCSVVRVFKAEATRSREKWKQMELTVRTLPPLSISALC